MHVAHIRHSEPWARNPEAAMLRATFTCNAFLPGIPRARQPRATIVRDDQELKIRSITAVTREVARATAISAPDSEMTLK